jgi:6-phosphogluconolactonase
MPSTATAADVDAGAAAYAAEMHAAGSGSFDLVMLGLGPDGHVASLFPGFPQLDVDDAIVLGVTGSPKPPPERITLTYGALNRTRAVWFLVSGSGKADAVARATAPTGDLHDTPARGIQPPPDASGAAPEIVWFLDSPAASAR